MSRGPVVTDLPPAAANPAASGLRQAGSPGSEFGQLSRVR